jgi:hypothetical protein
MRSFAATIPVFAGILALATAGELPLTPVATYPAVRPTHAPYNHGAPFAQRPAYPGSTTAPSQQGQQKPSVFLLTPVAANPTHTGTPTNPEKCSQVAARITPQLTPKPTYPPALKELADKLGGVDRDTCGEMDFKSRFKSAKPEDLNRFTQTRHSTFIMPIWAKVAEIWSACGDETRKMQSIHQEPCYRWALELSKSSNSSFGNGSNDKQQGSSGGQGSVKTPDLEAGVAKCGISQAAAVGAVGMLTLLWTVVLA